MEVAHKVKRFHEDLSYFVTFFRRNETFVPEGARFTLTMADSLHSLRSLGNVNQAKELFFRGTIVLYVMKRYLEVVMMFHLWNSLKTCESGTHDHSEECQRMKAIVRNNPELFPNQSAQDTKTHLFKAESDCLTAPKSGGCQAEWNRARQMLHERLRHMMSTFEEVVRVQLRQYFAERPAVSPTDLSSRLYRREEIVAVVSKVQRELLLEVQERNITLVKELGTFMSAEMASRFQAQLKTDQHKLKELESELQRVLQDAQTRLDAVTPPWSTAASTATTASAVSRDDVRSIIAEERSRDEEWSQNLGLDQTTPSGTASSAGAGAGADVDTALAKVDELGDRLKQSFGMMDGLVSLMEAHQTNMADLIDAIKQELEHKVANLTQQLDLVDTLGEERAVATDLQLAQLQQQQKATSFLSGRRLQALEHQQHAALELVDQRLNEAEDATESRLTRLQRDLARTQEQLRTLSAFRLRMLTLLASVMFVSVLAVLCEGMKFGAGTEFET